MDLLNLVSTVREIPRALHEGMVVAVVQEHLGHRAVLRRFRLNSSVELRNEQAVILAKAYGPNCHCIEGCNACAAKACHPDCGGCTECQSWISIKQLGIHPRPWLQVKSDEGGVLSCHRIHLSRASVHRIRDESSAEAPERHLTLVQSA